MPTSRGLRAACSGLLLALVALATWASPARADGTVVGGDRLGTRGIAIGTGAPALPATVASGWLVADLDTGAVLAAKDPHGRYAPASTLKTLTALTLIPRLDVHRQVSPTFDDVNVDGSRVGIVEHIAYPVDQLFMAMLMVSGNDAANALATANGGVQATVTQMNTAAAHLQALDTHAATPDGLDAPGQRSSPYDLALIARSAMQLPRFRHYVSTKHSQIRGPRGKAIAIGNHDRLLYNYPGAIGIKNGYTAAAQASFVGAATRGGHTLVVTLMHTAPRYWPEAAALLDWGFAAEARGAQPVGQLVNPLDRNLTTGSPAERSIATATTPPRGLPTKAGLPVLPVALVLTGVGATALVVRRRFA